MGAIAVPNDDYAKLMYYLHSIKAVGVPGIPEWVALYQNFNILSPEQKIDIISMCSRNPIHHVENSLEVPSESAPCLQSSLNAFIALHMIDEVNFGLLVPAAGRLRILKAKPSFQEVNILVYCPRWIEEYYTKPLDNIEKSLLHHTTPTIPSYQHQPSSSYEVSSSTYFIAVERDNEEEYPKVKQSSGGGCCGRLLSAFIKIFFILFVLVGTGYVIALTAESIYFYTGESKFYHNVMDNPYSYSYSYYTISNIVIPPGESRYVSFWNNQTSIAFYSSSIDPITFSFTTDIVAWDLWNRTWTPYSLRTASQINICKESIVSGRLYCGYSYTNCTTDISIMATTAPSTPDHICNQTIELTFGLIVFILLVALLCCANVIVCCVRRK